MRYLLCIAFISAISFLKAQTIYVKGKIKDAETGVALCAATVKFAKGNATLSDKNGMYFIKLSGTGTHTLSFSMIGYKTVSKNIVSVNDTVIMDINLTQSLYQLPSIDVTAKAKADTVFGTWKFSVADFEFYEDKLVLLTFKKNLKKAIVMLTDASQKILSSFELPDEAQKLFKDYMGHINIVCENHVYRIKIKDDVISLASLPVKDFNSQIVPCIDTIEQKIYFSNYSKDYPEFTYYAYNPTEKSLQPIKTITDTEQLDEYNMEYYFLKPNEQLYARKLASEYNVDKHRIAAIMSGITSSIFYTPLYAPMFILNDTICVFDHYSNAILKYNKQNQLLDSVNISYHHPKSWREWKHQIIVDSENNKAYALYQKNGFYYLKHINLKTGQISGSYKLSNQYVDKIKIKNDEVYYVYHPFESTQEHFIYKEAIRN